MIPIDFGAHNRNFSPVAELYILNLKTVYFALTVLMRFFQRRLKAFCRSPIQKTIN